MITITNCYEQLVDYLSMRSICSFRQTTKTFYRYLDEGLICSRLSSRYDLGAYNNFSDLLTDYFRASRSLEYMFRTHKYKAVKRQIEKGIQLNDLLIACTDRLFNRDYGFVEYVHNCYTEFTSSLDDDTFDSEEPKLSFVGSILDLTIEPITIEYFELDEHTNEEFSRIFLVALTYLYNHEDTTDIDHAYNAISGYVDWDFVSLNLARIGDLKLIKYLELKSVVNHILLLRGAIKYHQMEIYKYAHKKIHDTINTEHG